MRQLHTVWIGGKMPRLYRLCIESWVKADYEVRVFIYGDVEGFPEGAIALDGAELIPKIHYYEDDNHYGSPVLQANYLRYYYLLKYGGCWLDADTAFLRHPPNSEFIISSETLKSSPHFHPNLAFIKVPPNTILMQLCLEACNENIGQKRLRWGWFGPRLLARILQLLDMECLTVPPWHYCPIPHWYTEGIWFPDCIQIPTKAYGVHLWGGTSKKKSFDLDASYHYESFYEKLWRQQCNGSISSPGVIGSVKQIEEDSTFSTT